MGRRDYELIIFDCDGTLVDSEYLNNAVSAELITEFGIEGYDADRVQKNGYITCSLTPCVYSCSRTHGVNYVGGCTNSQNKGSGGS